MIKTKKISEEARDDDGFRVLVVSEWPEGLSRKDDGIDAWMKDLAPSKNLRDILKGGDWEGFKDNFYKELKEKKEMLQNLKSMESLGTVTLLHDSDREKNAATALKDYIDNKVRNL